MEQKIYLGKEIYKIDRDGYAEEARLTNLFDIADGCDIMVPVGNGFDKMKVLGCGTAFIAQDNKNITVLEFDKDERHCWCCVAILSKKELVRPSLEKGKT